MNPRPNRRPSSSRRGRHRKPRTCYPPFATRLIRLWRARIQAARTVPSRPAREITIEVRRRERTWLGRRGDV